MNTTTKAILGITAATAAGAILGMLLAPKKNADLLLKIKNSAKDWMNDFSSRITPVNSIKSSQKARHYRGEMTSELIDID